MLLKTFFETVYFPRKLRGKSENSVRLYRLCITQFRKTLGREPEVSDLTEDNVLSHLARRSAVAPATRNKELAEITAMWRLASQRKFLDTWPDIQPEVEPERAPIAWMPEELGKLMHTVENLDSMVGDVPAGVWWSAFLRVMLDSGERISAVRFAKWTWIQNDWILVPAEARKGKTRDRRYKISRLTMDALTRLRMYSKGEDVFPWPWSENYLWNKYKQILAKASLPSTRKHQLHCIRKTVGSAVYAAGLDPQDTLDHSDRRTTQRYLDPRFTRSRQACDVLSDYLSTPTPEKLDRREQKDRRKSG